MQHDKNTDYCTSISRLIDISYVQYRDLFIEVPKQQFDSSKNYLWILTTLLAGQYVIFSNSKDIFGALHTQTYSMSLITNLTIISSFTFIASSLYFAISRLYTEHRLEYIIQDPYKEINTLYNCFLHCNIIKFDYELIKTISSVTQSHANIITKTGIHLRQLALLSANSVITIAITIASISVDNATLQVLALLAMYISITTCIARVLTVKEKIYGR